MYLTTCLYSVLFLLAFSRWQEILLIYTQKKNETKENPRKQKNLFMDKAVPAYEKTIALNKDSQTAAQAQARINQIKQRYAVEPAKTAAGVPEPAQTWTIKLTEDVKYDTNIVNEAEGKLIKVSNTASTLNKTAFFAKYEHIFHYIHFLRHKLKYS